VKGLNITPLRKDDQEEENIQGIITEKEGQKDENIQI
jgi:hypothetical protein